MERERGEEAGEGKGRKEGGAIMSWDTSLSSWDREKAIPRIWPRIAMPPPAEWTDVGAQGQQKVDHPAAAEKGHAQPRVMTGSIKTTIAHLLLRV